MRTVNEMTHFESLNSIFITYFHSTPRPPNAIFPFFCCAPLNQTLILLLVGRGEEQPYFLFESKKMYKLGALFNLKSRRHVIIHGIKAAIKKAEKKK